MKKFYFPYHNLNELTDEAKKMINDIKKSGCDACLTQTIKALSIIKDNHNADACSRMKDYRCYQLHNKKLEKKIRALL